MAVVIWMLLGSRRERMRAPPGREELPPRQRHHACSAGTDEAVSADGVGLDDLGLVLVRDSVQSRLGVLSKHHDLGRCLVQGTEQLATFGDPATGNSRLHHRLELADDRVGDLCVRGRTGREHTELVSDRGLGLGARHERDERRCGGGLLGRHAGPDDVVMATDWRAGSLAASGDDSDAQVVQTTEGRGALDVVDLPRAVDDHRGVAGREAFHHRAVRVSGRGLDEAGGLDQIGGNGGTGDRLGAADRDLLISGVQQVPTLAIDEGQHEVAAGFVKPPATDAYGAMMKGFTAGNTAMIINGPWEVNNIKGAPAFGGLDNLGIAVVPAGSKRAGAPVGGHDYVIWSGMPTEKAAAATAFIAFMTSAETQATVADELGVLPTRTSAYAKVTNPIIGQFQPVMEAAVARSWIPEGGQLFGPLDEAATKIMVLGQDPKAALDAVANKYKTEVVKTYTIG